MVRKYFSRKISFIHINSDLIYTLLTISPGVDVMLVIGSSLKKGFKGGLMAALGISVGLLFYIDCWV